MSFLVIAYKFLISPYFRYFNIFPPISRKLLFPPTFENSPFFRKIYVFLHRPYFMCFSFPLV